MKFACIRIIKCVGSLRVFGAYGECCFVRACPFYETPFFAVNNFRKRKIALRFNKTVFVFFKIHFVKDFACHGFFNARSVPINRYGNFYFLVFAPESESECYINTSEMNKGSGIRVCVEICYISVFGNFCAALNFFDILYVYFNIGISVLGKGSTEHIKNVCVFAVFGAECVKIAERSKRLVYLKELVVFVFFKLF